MGDDIELRGIEVIYDGLLQMDLYNKTQQESYRVFVNPALFFGMLGKSMEKNYAAWCRAFEKTAPGRPCDPPGGEK